MPDDERTRRRLGDATKARIDELAAGWTVEPEPAMLPVPAPDATPTAAPDPPRARRRTQPPPPPGSTERERLEQAILATAPEPSDTIDDDAPRREVILATSPAPKASPPPIPRPAPKTSPPPIPRAATKSAPPPLPAERSPALDDRGMAAADATNVPRGEFELGARPTLKRDAAEALLQIPSPPATVVGQPPVAVLLGETAARLVRGDPTTINPQTSPFERGDPTSVQRDDATAIEAPAEAAGPGGTLRAASALRRKRGLDGDVRYVFTALFGVRAARRELVRLEERQGVRQTSRRRHLTTLGRTAVGADGLDHPALGKSREALATVEDERSKHAGAVAASDAELDRVRRDREVAAKAHQASIAAADVELAELGKKLEPLERDAAAVRKKASGLADQLRQIAKRVTDTEALLVSLKSEKMDRAAIQADIATLKADQKAVQRDEPALAADLDALEPRIAAIRAAMAEAEKQRTGAQAADAEDRRRTTELFEAIGAKRKVVERAAAEAEAARDRVLFELGERLYVDRSTNLAAQLAPIDQIDLELGESDRRAMELREILSNVDRAKIARGLLAIILVLAVAGAFVAWVLYMVL